MEGAARGAEGQNEAQKAARRKWMERPLAELRTAAEKVDVAAQSVLGECYIEGLKSLSKSPKLAAEWVAKAAPAGIAYAQKCLGWMHDHGIGVVQDKIEAARLYRLAAKQGEGHATHNLALCLCRGEGCDTDAVQAVQWMRRAVELGVADAQAELARWYMTGKCGLPVSHKEAHRLSRLGAEQGNAVAMTHLGALFGNGWGVARDLDETCKWYCQAAALGLERAKNNLRVLARSVHAPALAVVRELGLGPL